MAAQLPLLIYPTLRLPSHPAPPEVNYSSRVDCAPPRVRSRAACLAEVAEALRGTTTGDGTRCHGADGGMQLDAFTVLVSPSDGGGWLGPSVSDKEVQSQNAAQLDLSAVLLKPRRPAECSHVALSTSGYVYVPSTYTLLERLLLRSATLIEARRVVELGAGLGLLASG